MKKEPITILALSRLAELSLASTSSAKVLRGEVPPGEYEGEADVRIRYKVRVGEPYESVVSASVPWRDLAVSLMGKVSSAVRERTLREVLGGEVPLDDTIKAEVESAVRDMLGETVRVCSGKTTGKCEMEVL